MKLRLALAPLFAFAALALTETSCAPEGIDPSTLPEGVRSDYAVFAQRCSKCHSLSRPLNAGIQDDAWWDLYVSRMRRQPASGISEEDQVVILRFLHYYSESLKNKRNGGATTVASSASAAPIQSVSPVASAGVPSEGGAP